MNIVLAKTTFVFTVNIQCPMLVWHTTSGVEVADVVEATVLVVCIDPVGVRVPAVAATKMDVGMTPCTECAPMVQNQDVSGRPADKS